MLASGAFSRIDRNGSAAGCRPETAGEPARKGGAFRGGTVVVAPVETKYTSAIVAAQPSPEEIYARIEAEKIQFINLQFTDVMGMVKSVTIPATIFPHVVEGGQWIDGSSIAGFTRIAESDMYLQPDLSTFAVIPWEKDEFATARVICWVHNPNGDPFPGDPRGALMRQLEKLAELGYTYNVGP